MIMTKYISPEAFRLAEEVKFDLRVPPLLLKYHLYDPALLKHCENVALITAQMCIQQKMPHAKALEIVTAAWLHDIGKIHIPKSILNKTTKLYDYEYLLIKIHPVIGAVMSMQLNFSKAVTDIILHHHERMTGNGYPDHLKPEQISPGVRMVMEADAYEALTAVRPYGSVYSGENALYIMENSHDYSMDYIRNVFSRKKGVNSV